MDKKNLGFATRQIHVGTMKNTESKAAVVFFICESK